MTDATYLRRFGAKLNAYWPEYLAHHTQRPNRALHEVGNVVVLASLLTFNPAIVAAGVLTGYGFAFAGHYLIEKRKPATLEHPVLAAVSNWRMFWLTLHGQLDSEMAAHGLEST